MAGVVGGKMKCMDMYIPADVLKMVLLYAKQSSLCMHQKAPAAAHICIFIFDQPSSSSGMLLPSEQNTLLLKLAVFKKKAPKSLYTRPPVNLTSILCYKK